MAVIMIDEIAPLFGAAMYTCFIFILALLFYVFIEFLIPYQGIFSVLQPGDLANLFPT